MKRFVIMLCFSLLLINGVQSLTIEDTSGEERNYFSLRDDTMMVFADENSSGNVTISYTLFNTSHQKSYGLSSCGNRWCEEVRFSELFQKTNSSFVSSNMFNLSYGGETERVFLDLETPNIEINNVSINNSNRSLHLLYTINDSFGEIDEVRFYRRDGGNLSLLSEPKPEQDRQVFPLTQKGNLTLVIQAEDKGGNQESLEKQILVEDLFSPRILKEQIIKYEDQTGFAYEVEDENLSHLEVKQAETTLRRDLTGMKSGGEILLPFTSGSFKVMVVDNHNNSRTSRYDLDKSLEITLDERYLHDEEVRITSSEAESCKLLRLDGETEERTMQQDGDQFQISLSFNEERAYDFYLSCENDRVKTFAEKEVIYDTTPPSSPELEVVANEDGEMEISWTESRDDLLEVTYELYRDGDEVYDGDDTDYIDDEVRYPEEYTYRVKAIDLAGNEVDSDKVTRTPQKVGIMFRTPHQSQDTTNSSSYQFSFETEEQSNVSLLHLYNGSILDSYSITDVSDTKISQELDLKEGENRIELTINDSYGNQRYETFTITYQKPELNKEQESTGTTPTSGREKVTEKNSSASKWQIDDKEDKGFAFWWVFIVLILLILILISGWYAGQHEAIRYFFRSHFRNHRRGKKGNLHHQKRESDQHLNRHLAKVTKQRTQRAKEQREQKSREERQKQEKPPSHYHSRKIEEISGNKKTGNRSFPGNFWEGSRKTRRSSQGTDALTGVVSWYQGVRQQFILARQERKKQQLKKKDPFGSYLQRMRNASRWDSSQAYRQSNQQPHSETTSTSDEKTETKDKHHNSQQEIQDKKETETNRRREKRENMDLDAYLGKRQKKRNWHLTEKEVDRELRKRG